MKILFKTVIQKKKKYDYHKNKRYEYEQAFIIIPSDIAKKLEKGRKIRVEFKC